MDICKNCVLKDGNEERIRKCQIGMYIISGLLVVMFVFVLVLGGNVTDDTAFEDMLADHDEEGNVDAVFIMYYSMIAVVVLFASLCGGLTAKLNDKCFNFFF